MTEVVITGVGVVTPIGTGVDDMWEGLISGRSGAGEITHFDPSDLPVKFASEVRDFEPKDFMAAREVSRTDRFAQFAVAAAHLAMEHSGQERPQCASERAGVIVGSGIGGLITIEREHDNLHAGGPRRVSPFMVPKLMPNAAAAAIAMKLGINGVNYAPSSACATGAHAIGEAYRAIQHGYADVMLAGGCEAALTPLAFSAFVRMGALSTRNDDPQSASRPFDADRDGFLFGEGAGVLVLESREHAEKRGARTLAKIGGYGASADAFHVTQPDPGGKGASLAMKGAIADAGLEPEQIDYINAHGTSTPYNDRVETVAIKATFGNEAKRVPISSTKSQMGHLLGAAGAVEAGICALVIERSTIPPTINYSTADPDCDLDYVTEGVRSEKVRAALSNSFGFGGQNACLVFQAIDNAS